MKIPFIPHSVQPTLSPTRKNSDKNKAGAITQTRRTALRWFTAALAIICYVCAAVMVTQNNAGVALVYGLFSGWLSMMLVSPPLESVSYQWTKVTDSLPTAETPVLISVRGERQVGKVRWDYPGFEDTYEAFQYWDSPDNGRTWKCYVDYIESSLERDVLIREKSRTFYEH